VCSQCYSGMQLTGTDRGLKEKKDKDFYFYLFYYFIFTIYIFKLHLPTAVQFRGTATTVSSTGAFERKEEKFCIYPIEVDFTC